MSWYYYLEGKISFPFQARCIAAKVVSPLRKRETIDVRGLAPEDACASDMLVQIRWQGRKMAVPPSQLAAIDPDESEPTWTDVKAELASFDRLGLLGLIQDLYAAPKDNQTFLHARFGLGEDVPKPYKETLDSGSGRTYCGTRIRPWLKPNRPSPATEKLSANRLEPRS
jgi:hypothetical protein